MTQVPTTTKSDEDLFQEWVKTLPKAVQQNIKDSGDRNESYTRKAFFAGLQAK